MNEAIEAISQILADLSPEDRAALASLLGQAPGPIAIVGTGCRFPGGADDEERFWELLRDGRDGIREVPRERWDVDAYYDPDPQAPGKSYTRYGGFLDGVDRFDAPFFEISPREARSMDPQQRLLLEVCWEALERAGLAADDLSGRSVGVFVGSCLRDYEILVQRAGANEFDAHTVTGGLSSVLAGRISHVLGLHGPAIALDTACSSSLVALHLACQSLRNGECELALAAGVNLILAPEGMVMLSRLGALAPDGRCKTFDVRANGFARGEGCGVLVLKRLSDAMAADDDILAVIRGSAVNHDGRSAGLAAPNGIAQRAVVARALESAGVSPESIGYLEAHGTGTPLGDPIEIDSLKHTFRARADGSRCSLGSVKTNVGHLEAAAGVASVLKVALAMKNEAIPPHLHFTSLNPRISFEGSPFAIPTRLEPWPRGKAPRLAGVSSFGLSGTNAHVVMEEAPVRARRPRHPAAGSHVLTLSAKSPRALKALAERYAALLTAPGAPSLADVAYSANTGRARFACRLALVASDGAQAAAQLRAFVEDRPAAGLHAAVLAPGARPAGDATLPGALETLAQAFITGAKVDWAAVHRESPGRRVLIPTYPFERERHWIDAIAPEPEAAPTGGPPLVVAIGPIARAERGPFLIGYIGKIVRTILLLDEAVPLDPERRLDELGMDSLLALDLVNALNAETGLDLPMELLLQHPNLGSIAGYVDGCLSSTQGTLEDGPRKMPL
ncbi:phosphopantetheine-binding protein [Pendulispora rubella]|uniref:Phosphopantetheine-binding protein n=1 Tax=Pendulispora rubella TaxID=2741070 RepID=A0ABZ2L5M3_9BACT